MSFITATIGATQDREGFLASWNNVTKPKAIEMGSMDTSVVQFVMGGEMAGLMGVSMEWESVDAAMEGSEGIMSDPGVREALGSTGTSVVRRSIMEILAEDGVREGKYLSCTYVAGGISAEAQEVGWRHAQSGANGFMTCGLVAGGMAGWAGAVFAWTDSVDAMNASRASMMADPQMQQIMAKNGTSPVGRVIMRVL
ncbi:MAG: hypothetical protein CL460_09425 [Acidimicrobiaceae bacterium]|jgi:hypothetical protein|nr:hypothetical protein [Acidimicrobiaceae bacterium]MEC9474021.1 hypothetical protein [Actinomycetota bacterium]MEE3256220.1 hypothetical protein [Actinomycetota bacterium]|tara:strand:+ start:1365 stop:1955 length:591 start_codon:yes stop_codon:yes gene_type:complete